MASEVMGKMMIMATLLVVAGVTTFVAVELTKDTATETLADCTVGDGNSTRPVAPWCHDTPPRQGGPRA